MCWCSLKTKQTVVLPLGELSWSAPCGKGGSSVTAEESEEAGRLLTAARSDLRAAKALAADTDQANDVIGFHAQQAVEKAIKAVLVTSGKEIPYTHDIAFLLDMVAGDVTPTPEAVAQADWLTPWAVAARYGPLVTPLDRKAAIVVADGAVGWATGIVGDGA